MTHTRKILDVLFGHLDKGETASLPVDIDLDDALELSTPVLPPADPSFSRLIEEARRALQAEPLSDVGAHPLSDEVRALEHLVVLRLAQYLESGSPGGDRLYVLEFQGARQYLMFGHSTNVLVRVSDHQRAATPHGFALLNGWASPVVANAQPVEQAVLTIGGMMHRHLHFRERFYDMPFEKGLSIARAVFELNTDWRPALGQTEGRP
ncbi:MAG: hypothetical protein ACRDJB_01365 [Actinomycetota bacterium]